MDMIENSLAEISGIYRCLELVATCGVKGSLATSDNSHQGNALSDPTSGLILLSWEDCLSRYTGTGHVVNHEDLYFSPYLSRASQFYTSISKFTLNRNIRSSRV